MNFVYLPALSDNFGCAQSHVWLSSPSCSKAGEEPACLEDVEDDDEEIFFGSVGFAEQCVSKAVEITEEEQEVLKPLSPLSAEEWVQVRTLSQSRVAHLVGLCYDDIDWWLSARLQ